MWKPVLTGVSLLITAHVLASCDGSSKSSENASKSNAAIVQEGGGTPVRKVTQDGNSRTIQQTQGNSSATITQSSE